MKRIYKILLSLAVVCVFTAIIFSFSEQNGSDSHSISRKVSYKIISTLLQDTDVKGRANTTLEDVANLFDFPVRKAAHVCIYLGLGLIVITGLWFVFDYDLHYYHVLLTLLVVFLVGCADETIQYFSGGRGATIKDVLIDTCGGLLGIGVHFMIRDLIRHLSNAIRKK